MCSVCGECALGAQPRAMLDAEPVLFVDDRQSEPFEIDAFGQQRVGADRERRFAAGQPRNGAVARPPALAPEHGFDGNPQRQQQRRQFAQHAATPESPSAPSARTARRCATPSTSRPRPPASFRCRRRPATGGSSERRASCRPKSPRSRVRCAPVSANGSDAENSSSSPEGTRSARAPRSRSRCARRSSAADAIAKNSPNTNRSRARCASSGRSGA